MRWTKQKKTPPYGTERIRTWFAWFPVKICDEWRWLETVRVEQWFLFDDKWENQWFLEDDQPTLTGITDETTT